jgi:hypothetical protein
LVDSNLKERKVTTDFRRTWTDLHGGPRAYGRSLWWLLSPSKCSGHTPISALQSSRVVSRRCLSWHTSNRSRVDVGVKMTYNYRWYCLI